MASLPRGDYLARSLKWLRDWRWQGDEELPQRGIISTTETHNPLVRLGRIIVLVLLILILLTMIFPLYWLFTAAFKSPIEIAQYPPTFWPQHPDWSNLGFVWNAIDWPLAFRNTLILATVGWFFSSLIQTMAAYSLSQVQPDFAPVILFIFLSTTMIPSIVLVIPQYLNILDLPLIHQSLTQTPLAIWVVAMFNAWGIFIYKIFFDQVPKDLVDCARLEGASHFTIYLRVCLPIVRPVIIVGLITSFIADWTGYFWPLLTIKDSGWDPVGLVLLKAQTLPVPDQIAAAVIGSIVPFVLVAIFQNQIIKSNAAFAGLKG